MHVEVLESTMNFQCCFVPVDVGITGITTTKGKHECHPRLAHCLQEVCPRPSGHIHWQIENTMKEWGILPEYDKYAILFCKLAMCAQVFFPYATLGHAARGRHALGPHGARSVAA